MEAPASYPHVISVGADGKRTLSIFLPGERPIVVPGDHPQYDRLLFEAEQGELSPQEIINYVLPIQEERN